MALPKMIVDADLELIKFYIILPLILTTFERDHKIIKDFDILKTPDPYLEVIERAMDSVTKDLAVIRKGFKDRGIKVYDEHQMSNGVHAEYLCRGYHGKMHLQWGLIKAEVFVLMRKHLGLDVSKYKDNGDMRSNFGEK
ncbi:hypothetical protein [Paenibacillus macquariensis]|uniref:Uncharacterized protein n=1 Tax=Paenibacillus macquariensis TaxID=948756 RepID=A0ABY1JSB0_9BACL|nr:hypothetical protein [Paenibacillus macquariensis]MEC0092906.1 hypothetical protein [Paenibacillus macquariensis]OAB36275.1 hypothetical protein PMSM_07455 [Paenibacillus macquariensis subsp. macquariensis]SIQ68499.1 hypothetical protein SAMN05421578_103360 [Paenibacillus macquariensis]